MRATYDEVRTGFDDACLFVLLPHHESSACHPLISTRRGQEGEGLTVLDEDDGCTARVAKSNELRRLVRLGREEDVVVRNDTNGESMDVSPAADETRAVKGFELDESRAVDDSADEFADFPGLSDVC